MALIGVEMRIQIDVTKKKFLLIFLGIVLSVGGVFVIAAAPNPGHLGSQIDLTSVNGGNLNWISNLHMNGLIKETDNGGQLTGDHFGFDNDDGIVFRTGGNNRLEIHSNGDVDVKNKLCFNGANCRSNWGGTGGSGCTLVDSVTNNQKEVNVPAGCIGSTCNLLFTLTDSGSSYHVANFRYIQGIPSLQNAGVWVAEGGKTAASGLNFDDLLARGVNGGGTENIISYITGSLTDDGTSENSATKWNLVAGSGFTSSIYIC